MCVFVDTSASMRELGKFSGVLYFLRSLKDYELYKFNGERISLNQLRFNENLPLNESINSHEKTLILSDGLFKIEGQPRANLAVCFGIDGDKAALEKIAKKVLSVDLALEILVGEL